MGITLDPLNGNNTYTPISFSVANWGPAVGGSVAECPGITVAPEYFTYTQDPFSDKSGVPPQFSIVQVGRIVDSKYGWYGLKNLYNAMAFVQSYVD